MSAPVPTVGGSEPVHVTIDWLRDLAAAFIVHDVVVLDADRDAAETAGVLEAVAGRLENLERQYQAMRQDLFR